MDSTATPLCFPRICAANFRGIQELLVKAALDCLRIDTPIQAICKELRSNEPDSRPSNAAR